MADYGKHTKINTLRTDSSSADFKEIKLAHESIKEGYASDFRQNINDNFDVIIYMDKKLEETNKKINGIIDEIWTDKHGIVVASGVNKPDGVVQAPGEVWIKLVN